MKELIERFGGEEEIAIWQPDSMAGETKVHIFTGKSVSEHVLDKALSKIDEVGEGVMPAETLAELKDMLANRRDVRMIGGPMEEMLLPANISETLNDFHDKGVANLIDAGAVEIVGRWKQWTLFNPARFAKYYLNNMTSDIDALIATKAGRPVAKKIPQAWREVRAMIKENKLTPELQEALEKGVIQSSMTMTENRQHGRTPAGSVPREENTRRSESRHQVLRCRDKVCAGARERLSAMQHISTIVNSLMLGSLWRRSATARRRLRWSAPLPTHATKRRAWPAVCSPTTARFRIGCGGQGSA